MCINYIYTTESFYFKPVDFDYLISSLYSTATNLLNFITDTQLIIHTQKRLILNILSQSAYQ